MPSVRRVPGLLAVVIGAAGLPTSDLADRHPLSLKSNSDAKDVTETKNTDLNHQDVRGSSEYEYTVLNDCYRHDVKCPEGTFCQVEERMNWYPWDVSYMNRGRCIPYAKLYGACEVEIHGAPYPRKEDGGFYERSTYCDPSVHTCSGHHVFVMPPSCVEKRSNLVCMSTKEAGCAGRPSEDACPDSNFVRAGLHLICTRAYHAARARPHMRHAPTLWARACACASLPYTRPPLSLPRTVLPASGNRGPPCCDRVEAAQPLDA